jgi:hypothetical protein
MNSRHASLNLSANSAPIAFAPLSHASEILEAVQQTINALAAGLVDDRTARTILYGLQIASTNLKRAEKEAHDVTHEAKEPSSVPVADKDCGAASEPEAGSAIEAEIALTANDGATQEEGQQQSCDGSAEVKADEAVVAPDQVEAQLHTSAPHTYRGSVQLRRLELQRRAIVGRGGGV